MPKNSGHSSLKYQAFILTFAFLGWALFAVQLAYSATFELEPHTPQLVALGRLSPGFKLACLTTVPPSLLRVKGSRGTVLSFGRTLARIKNEVNRLQTPNDPPSGKSIKAKRRLLSLRKKVRQCRSGLLGQNGSSSHNSSLSSAPANRPPSVTIYPIADKLSGEMVILEASAQDLDGDSLAYAWRQVDSQLPSIELYNVDTSKVFFIAPDVTERSYLTIQLIVTDSGDPPMASAPAALTLAVSPNPCSNGERDGAEDGIDCGGDCPFACPTNWKSGISVSFHGTAGRDYAEEYFYHDKLIDDHKVVYIKDTTPIVMTHNERNSIATNDGAPTIIGEYGPNGVKDDLTTCLSLYPAVHTGSCDDGIIRLRIDRDLQNKYTWAARYGANGPILPATPLYPAYTGPFSFAQLDFSPDDPGVPVVGSTGPRLKAELLNRAEFYYRGLQDDFGDEWHSISYADDDTWRNIYYVETWSSDGKSVLFVVNPRTPLISFESKDPQGQFYTTPPKVNFLPVLHAQTTFLTDGVEIKLVNITTHSPVYCRIDRGSFELYESPILSADLSPGEHTIEYFFDPNHIKARRLVKDPPFPSDQDFFEGLEQRHGYLMWPDDQKFAELQERLLIGSLASEYSSKRDNHGQWGGTAWNIIDQVYRKGLRTGAPALLNALVVAIEGADARPEHAAYAKKALLDSQLNIDHVGSEVPTGQTPNPSREMYYHGYYAVNVVYDKAFAYDLLIKHYRADAHPGGISAIEDYKIRDLLAARNLEIMKGLGGYRCYPQACSNLASTAPLEGMWDFAEYSGAHITALAMPAYDSPYYGTSGYNGTAAAHPWTPYPDYPASWKDALFTSTNRYEPSHVERVRGYPNQQYMFNHLDGGLITDRVTPVNRTLGDGTVVTELPAGSWSDRIGYYSFSLMGHTLHFLALVNKIKFNHTYPWLELSFEHANNGTLFGIMVNSDDDEEPQYFTQFLLINEYFPDIAGGAEAYLPYAPDQRFQYIHSPFGLVWYNPDWRDYVP